MTNKRGLLLQFIGDKISVEDEINPARIYESNSLKADKGSIIYWMSRDQRVNDNWSLLFAQQKAKELNQPFFVIFCLVPDFLEATIRQYGFMLKGLEKVEKSLQEKNIPFYLLKGNPTEEIPKFINKIKAGLLITDFDPLKIKQIWKNQLLEKIKIPFCEVDSHNVIPSRFISDKKEFAASTIRPKVYKYISDFFTDYPPVKKQEGLFDFQKINWTELIDSLKIDKTVKEVNWLKSGEDEALKILEDFIDEKLYKYSAQKNDPNIDAQSNLSPYLHFGQISSQRIAVEIYKSEANKENKEAYLEELITRKELADNFCLFEPDYDNFKAFPAWAQNTLNEHRNDLRTYTYTLEEFEKATTHDDLWNAAQLGMVTTGKMHGYMRMYWCKKILEWTKTPEESIKIAIYLNDKYELDGRDPNGYAGIAWSIGGIHDRAWGERDILGKVRYMSYNGCKGKFDVSGYIEKYIEKNNSQF